MEPKTQESVLDDLINKTAGKEAEYIENKVGGNLKEKEKDKDESPRTKSTPAIEATEKE